MTSNNIIRFPAAAREDNSGRRLIPARLFEARIAKLWNQTDLAAQVGVSRQAISSYEMGEKTPEPPTMRALAEVLGQPMGYFTKEQSRSFGTFSANFFRKTGADTKRRNLACEVYARWLSETSFAFDDAANFPVVDVPRFEPRAEDSSRYEVEEIEEIAEATRAHFGLGLGPISNVIRLMESKGIIVSRMQIPGEKIEAFSYWNGSRPFVFLASEKDSCARARFDAAHELGHIVLHRWIDKNEIEDKGRLKEIESEANRFASAFLLPRRSFPNEVYSPRILAFVDLKARWRVSIQAMVYRCKDLGVFDEQQVTNLYKQISEKKWRTNEPYDGPAGFPLEEPILLRKIAQVVLERGRLSKENLLEEVAIAPRVVEQLLGLDAGYLAPPPDVEFEPTLK